MIVLGFYKFSNIEEPEEVATSLREFCIPDFYMGTILVSHEGLNGSVSANRSDTDALRAFLQEIPGFSDLFEFRFNIFRHIGKAGKFSLKELFSPLTGMDFDKFLCGTIFCQFF